VPRKLRGFEFLYSLLRTGRVYRAFAPFPRSQKML
jgi:hypothetical protein